MLTQDFGIINGVNRDGQDRNNHGFSLFPCQLAKTAEVSFVFFVCFGYAQLLMVNGERLWMNVIQNLDTVD